MKRQKGFTLIEVLLVVVILGIIAVIAIPRLMATKDEGLAKQASDNLREIVRLVDACNAKGGKFANLKELSFVATGDTSIVSSIVYNITITDDTGGYKATATLPSGVVFYVTNANNEIK